MRDPGCRLGLSFLLRAWMAANGGDAVQYYSAIQERETGDCDAAKVLLYSCCGNILLVGVGGRARVRGGDWRALDFQYRGYSLEADAG
jgi:hypothetical protein